MELLIKLCNVSSLVLTIPESKSEQIINSPNLTLILPLRVSAMLVRCVAMTTVTRKLCNHLHGTKKSRDKNFANKMAKLAKFFSSRKFPGIRYLNAGYIRRNFRQEKIFANFAICYYRYWRSFYHANFFLSCVIRGLPTTNFSSTAPSHRNG